MNDHNLDDLIIDTPTQKGGKAKGLLTIIALLIVVMIAAIVLTKIILKDPSAQPAILEENDVEIISPELTLQHATEESSSPQDEKELPLSEIIEEEVSAPQKTPETAHKKIKPETVEIAEETQKSPAVAQTVKPTAAHPKGEEVVQVPKTIRSATRSKTKPTTKPKPKPKPKNRPKPATKPAIAQGTFYIQVGSFSKTPEPNSRLITAIRKQGFKHRILTVGGMKKVVIGPYSDRASADRASTKVKDLINKNAFIIKR
jgi:DedD protein